MIKKQMVYYVPAIILIVILIIAMCVTISTIITKNDIVIDIAYFGSIASVAAVVLALTSIGISIKEADIDIYLGEKKVTSDGTLQQIRITNEGNALGNMAHVFIDIQVDPSSTIFFEPAAGLSFEQTTHTTRKQYRLDNPNSPMNLYPGKYIWNLLGYIANTVVAENDVNFDIQVIGSQGRKIKKFKIKI